MKIVFHKDFNHTDYASDGAAAAGRMESIMEALSVEDQYDVVSPLPASYEDLFRAHSQTHIENIAKDDSLFKMAALSAGGAIVAAEIAFKEEPAFACIRPPGHHASKASTWGYCAFCNMGIALLRLKEKGLIKSAFVLDFDAHKGDGTIDVLSGWKDVKILNPMADDNNIYIKVIEDYIAKIKHVDIIAVSAGFDSYEKDLGKKLKTFDFYLIGRLMKKLAKKMRHHRRFAILEGGYYQPDLGKNVLAFCQGFE